MVFVCEKKKNHASPFENYDVIIRHRCTVRLHYFILWAYLRVFRYDDDVILTRDDIISLSFHLAVLVYVIRNLGEVPYCFVPWLARNERRGSEADGRRRSKLPRPGSLVRFFFFFFFQRSHLRMKQFVTGYFSVSESIARGQFPRYRLCVQLMPEEEGYKRNFAFDWWGENFPDDVIGTSSCVEKKNCSSSLRWLRCQQNDTRWLHLPSTGWRDISFAVLRDEVKE